MTVLISVASMLLSLALGILSAAGRSCRILVLRYLCSLYVTFIRGTPLIMQIYLFYYIVGTAWGIENRFAAGVLILSVFEGAYISEIIRGSLLSMDESQLEAARAVGFTKKQTLRYVIFPQMVARTLPALTGQFASVIKDSSLLSMISVIELTQAMREISAGNLKLVESYLFLGVLYLLLTLPRAFYVHRLPGRTVPAVRRHAFPPPSRCIRGPWSMAEQYFPVRSDDGTSRLAGIQIPVSSGIFAALLPLWGVPLR